MGLQIRKSTVGEAIVVSLSGELDLATVPVLEQEFAELAAAGKTHLVVDAGAVTFMDGTGLHGLAQAQTTIKQAGSHFHLVPSRFMIQVLDLLQADTFPRFASVEEALTAMGEQTQSGQ